MDIAIGLILVVIAGLGTGTVAWPMKKIKEIHFEQFLFVFMLTGLIICPWAVVLVKIPDLWDIVATVGTRPLLISNILSICWGIANVLYLICVVRIGAALTGAILSASGMSVGVIIPMVFKGSGLFANSPDLLSPAGTAIISGLVIIIIGISLVSAAGFGRERMLNLNTESVKREQASGNFGKGLLLVIAAGLLSGCISLAFVYSQGPVISAAKAQGVGDITANFTVWALCIFGGGMVNVLYALHLMARNNSWNLLFSRKDELLYGAIAGAQFISAIVLLGKGMILLGALGASIGVGIQQSLQVIGNQLVGFMGGEWKGVYGRPRKLMYLGLGVILISVVVLAYSNTIG